jgi:hypothetical protein
MGDKDFEVNPGDRIAQLVLEQILMVPVEEVQELDVTVRGAGGFGSTGISAISAANKKARTISPAGEEEEEQPSN